MTANAIKLLDGQITLRQRGSMNTQTWTAEFKLPGKTGRIKKATGTRDIDEAKRVAQAEFYKLIALDQLGLDTSPKKFKRVAHEFMQVLRHEVDAGERKQRTVDDLAPIVNRYYLPFFGEKAIDTISDSDLRDYLQWRKTYWTEGPGKEQEFRVFVNASGKTVKMRMPHKEASLCSGELRGIKQIFRLAGKKGWIDAAKIPEFPPNKRLRDKRKHQQRPAFMPEEWTKVVRNMAHYARKTDHPEVRYDRQMLIYYMLIMANTGMRPTDEHALVQWKHVEQFEHNGSSYCRVWIGDEGKTGSRKIVCHPDVYKWLMKIRDFSRWTSSDDYVFANKANGKPIKSFLKGMKAFLATINLATNKQGRPFCPYSLRHTYATHRLINGVDPWVIAKNMGHKNTQMLAEFYGQDDPEYRPHELTKSYEDIAIRERHAMLNQGQPGTYPMEDTSDIDQFITEVPDF